MKKLILFFAFLTLLLIPFSNRLYASHAMGADLTYRCLGGLQYEFTLSLYRDCSGISLPASTSITLSSSSCSRSQSLTVTRISTAQVTPVCASQIGLTTCGGTGALPGVEEHIYRATVTLPQSCSDWLFSYSLNARNPSINTVSNPGSLDIYIESTLNTVAAPCNSSPTFVNSPVPFVCLNGSQTYNSDARDTDGDSLIYTLIDARSAANSVVPYIGTFSGTNPISSTPPVTIDANNGTIDMNPTASNIGVMAIKVDEYRNGVLIGSVIRDVQIQVQNCGTNNTPTFSAISNLTGGFQPSNFRIEICPGQNISFNITGSDADIANALTMTSNSGVTGATFTTTGSNPVTGTFSWSPTTADLGFHSLVLTMEDDGCPFKGIQSLGLEIWVLDGAYAGPDVQTCANGSQAATIAAVGGSIFGWSVVSGDLTSLTCQTCPTQVVTPTQTTTYELLTNFTCGNRDSVTVFVNPVTSLTSKNDTAICGINNNIQLFTSPAATGTYSYSWSPSIGLSSSTISNPVATPPNTTKYYVTVTDQNNCEIQDSTTVTVSGNLLDGTPASTDNVYCSGDSPIRLYSGASNGDCEKFVVSSIAYNPISTNLNTVSLGDDAVATIPIGMSFQYFCNNFTNLTVSSNGWVSFNTYGTGQSFPTDVAIPNGADPNNLIALAWDDLNPNSGGSISYGISGTAPNRRFVLNYTNIRHFGSTQSVSTQLILYETSNIIEIHNTNVQNDGGPLTQGIEGPLGTDGISISGRNNQVWTASNSAIRFTPALPQPYTVTWQAPLGTTIGTGDSIDVSPAVNTNYYAILTDVNSGCTDTLSHVNYAEFQVEVAAADAGPNRTILAGNPATLDGSYNGPLPPPNCNDYQVTSIANTPYALGAPTNAGPLAGNSYTAAIPIGFSFDFYCTLYNQIFVSEDGYLTFTNGTSVANPQTVPTAAVPNNLIAFCWTELENVTLSYETQGLPPNRRFVMNILGYHFFSSSFCPPVGCPVNMQVVLHESSEIDFYITQIDASWFSPMTQGIEGPGGSLGVAVAGRNAVFGWTATNEAYRFEPRPNNIVYSWTPAATLNDSTLEDPDASPLVDTWYYLTVNNGICSTTDSVLVTVQPLPIELLDFRGSQVDQASVLEWESILEANADYFEVEHSRDLSNFKAVGKVNAVGESGSVQQYEFVHRNPAYGFNYYRLRMVDQDGQFSYSDVIEINFTAYGNGSPVQVHPNPGTDVFYFDFGISGETQAYLEVLNMAGQVVARQSGKLNLGKHQWSADLGELPSGVYLYRLRTDSWTASGKLHLVK